MPIVMILHVVMPLRALAGNVHAKDTDAFADNLANAFGTASVQGVNTLLHKGLKVTTDEVNVKDRVAVRFCCSGSAIHTGRAATNFVALLTRMCHCVQ